jgi:membrane-associated phospholipid phosphatase
MSTNLQSTPLVIEETPRSTWARVASDLLSPPVIWGVMAFPVAFRAAESVGQALLWALTYTLLVCIIPALYVAFMVWRGHISDMHINLREQRIRPFIVSLIGTGVAWFVLTLMGAPSMLPLFTLFTLVQTALMLFITMRWKISMHTMSISGAVVVTGALYGFMPALIVCPLIPVVGAARLKLRRHTLSQVVAGIAVGGGVSLLMWAISAGVWV